MTTMDVLLEAYAPQHKKVRVSQIKEVSEQFGMPIAEAIRARLRFLHRVRERLEEMALVAADSTDGVMLEASIRISLRVGDIRREIKTVQQYNKPVPAGNITDDMVATAKAYPIEQLVEFDRSGKAVAWCHPDKSPSLSWHRKANRCHCFPCGKSFNPVDVLMGRDGMTFVAAVKALQ